MRPLVVTGKADGSVSSRTPASPRQQSPAFTADDDDLLALWAAGHSADEIAGIVGVPEPRVLHDLDRILGR